MGLYDRDYASAGANSDFRERFASSSMTTKLIAVTVAIYLVDNLLFAGRPVMVGGRPVAAGLPWLTEHLAINPGLFQVNWRLWELVTYGFAHSPLAGRPGIWHIVGNMYGLWFFGKEVEKVYGAREFLFLYLGLIAFSALAWCGVEFLVYGGVVNRLLGASGAVAGMVVLFALHFPQRKLMLMFLPFVFPAWMFGVFVVGMDMLGAMGLRSGNVAFVVHLAGAGLAVGYFYSGIRLSNGFSSISIRRPRFGPKLRVHRPSQSLDLRADKILEKISREGADSLTAVERKVLEDYSRRVRNRRE